MSQNGITAKAIERGGEGLALLSLKVTNLDEAITEMEVRGIRQVKRVNYSKWKAVLFHPADTYGVMIELIEYEYKHSLAATIIEE